MKYGIRKKAAALMMSVIMVLQMLPLSGLASQFDATTESFSLAGISALAAPNDGGTITGVGTDGASAEISVGASVTFTTVRMGDLFTGINNNTSFEYSFSPASSSYLSYSAVSTGSGTNLTYSITLTGLKPTVGAQTIDFTIRRINLFTTRTATIPLSVKVVQSTGTVNFINRGQTIQSVAVPLGSKIGEQMHADLVEPGYIFDGWYTAAGKRVTANTIVNQDIDAYARWLVTLSFETNGGEAIDPMTVVADQAVGALPTPVKAGFAFAGWFADEQFTQPVTGAASFSVNATLYAKWATDGHMVRYYSYNGTLLLSSYLVADGAFIDPLAPPPPAAGYGFTGWYTQAQPDGELFDFAATPITAPIDFYAHQARRYTVSFSTSGSYVPVQQVFEGEAAVKPAQDPTRTGYTFVRWSLEAGGENAYDFSTPVMSDTKIYAVWAPSADITFRVLYWYQNAAMSAAERDPGFVRGYTPGELVEYTNGVAGGTLRVDTSNTTHSLVVSSGGTDTTLGTIPNKQRTYFQYAKYQPNVTISGTGTTIFNVYYDRIPYTVTFDLNNGNGRMTVGGIPYTGTAYTITAKYNDYISDLWPWNEDVIDTTGNQAFNRWVADGVTQNSHVYNLTSNLINANGTAGKTLKAEWTTESYHYFLVYMFESLDGSNPHGALGTHTYGGTVGTRYHTIADAYMQYTAYGADIEFGHKSITGLNGTSDDDVIFNNGSLSWADAFNLLHQDLKDIYNGFSNTQKNRSRIQILYYYRDRGNLVFDTMGVSVPGMDAHNATWANQMYEADISGSEPTHLINVGDIVDGLRFDGWYTAPDYVSKFVFSGATMPLAPNAGNVYVYAKWSPQDYVAKYYLSKTTSAVYYQEGVGEGGYTTPPVSTPPEYGTLLGWYWNNPDTGAFEPFSFETPFTEDSTDDNGEIKLYAVWDIAGLKVTYDANGVDAQGNVPVDNNEYTSGATVTVDEQNQNTLTRPGYLFGGWSTQPTGDAEYAQGDTFVITEDTTLYAVWIPLITLTATKQWMPEGLLEELKVPVKFQLYRVSASEPSTVVDGEVEVTSTTNWANTWSNLLAHDSNGNEYTYTVKEVGETGNQITLEGNTYGVSYGTTAAGLEVTNSYVIPTQGEATGTKTWKDGPEEHPTVWFKLYRSIEGGTAEAVPGAEVKELPDGTLTVTWEGLEQTDIDGNAYTFSVKEVDAEGNDWKPEHYEKSEAGLEVTNSYVIPTQGEATGTKTWKDGPEEHPTVWFKLYRSIEDGTAEAVPGAEVKALANGTLTVTWEGLEETDANGNAYTFSVKEVDAEGNDWKPEHYEKSEAGLGVTNSYVIPTQGEATGTKTWKDGPEEHPTVWFKLYRSIAGGTAEAVPGAEVKALADGTLTVTWEGLEQTDIDGNAYTFSVKEVDAEGNDWKPEHYEKSEAGLEVTNSYVIPTQGEATATKAWENGPATHPTVWFKLYRNIEGGTAEAVPGAEVKALENGTLTVTWEGLEETDANGNAYTFSVKEVDDDGNDWKPDNYDKTENALVVTNTYVSPKISVTANKVWTGNAATHPTIWFKLYRNIEGGEAEEVPATQAPLKQLDSGTLSVTWTDIDKTNSAGVDYIFTVKEVDNRGNDWKPEHFEKTENGLQITNAYKASGSWTPAVTKVLTGRALKDGEFSFQLKDAEDEVLQTKQNVGNTVTFDPIAYSQDDIGKSYTYIMNEVAGSVAGVTYDLTIMTITVTVADAENGQLTVTPIYPDDTEFNNSYASLDVTAEAFKVSKALTGRALKDGEFSFELYAADSSFAVSGDALQTKQNVGNTVTFDPITYTDEDTSAGDNVSTYYYVIKEVNGGLGGITYDMNEVHVTVTVTDNGMGKLTAAVAYSDDTEFDNSYASEDVMAEAFKVSKALTGRTLKDGEFSFELYAADSSFAVTGAALQTKQNVGNTVTFDPITYTDEDTSAGDNVSTYYYVIKEVNGGLGGITYDMNEVHVTVTVTDNGMGKLTAAVAYSDDTEFDNVYEAYGEFDIDAELNPTKTLTGRMLTEDEFEFELKLGETILQTVRNTKSGNIPFKPLEYTEADAGKTYTYTITEIAGSENGMTYDPMVLTFSVTVTDNGDGTLSTSLDMPEDVSFDNKYEAGGEYPINGDTKISLNPAKKLEGRDLKEGEFSFQLKNADGKVLETIKNTADGRLPFKALLYTEADIGKTYSYTITEVKPAEADANISYDKMVLNFKVTVADAGNGVLTTTAEKPADITFNNVYTAPDKPMPPQPLYGVSFNAGDCYE